MVKTTTVQAAHSYGVLSPHVIERRDTKFVAGSLSDGSNIVLLPSGGWTHRGGSTDVGGVRGQIFSLAINTTILSLPNGGSESDLLAGTKITISGATGTRFVLFQCDFAVATRVDFVDVKGVSIATTPASNALIAEYWDGAAWIAFGAPAKITLAAYTRRFASGPPGSVGPNALKIRVCLDATTAAGDVTLTGLALWSDSEIISRGMLRRYRPEGGAALHFVISDRNMDVYEGATWRAAVPLPVTEARIRQTKAEAKFDTILFWHTAMRPQAVRMLGAVTEWACDPVSFLNIPLVDYGGIYSNGINCVQQLTFYSLSPTERFDLTVEGQTTAAITVGANDAATVANITAAIEALSNVGTGIVVTSVSPGNNDQFTVEFAGVANAGRDWLTMTATALDANGYIRVSKNIVGKAPGEPMFSDARGWPAVGRFAQQRLIMAGLPQNPNAFIASVLGDPFNLNTEVDIATSAFSYEIDGSENTRVMDMLVSRTLLFFGDQQVAYLRNSKLSASDRPEFGLSDAPGIQIGTSAIASDNALFYVQEGGNSLRMLTYSEIESNYVGDNASVLSSHLIKNPIDMARRRALGAVDSDLMMLVNADGTMTVQTLMRTQEVSGFAPWSTDGTYEAICVDHDNEAWVLATRLHNDVPQIRRERLEPEKLLDEALEYVFMVPTATITGLTRFNGRIVHAVTPNETFGPFTVTGGTITLPKTIATTLRVGTWPRPSATDAGVSLEQETAQRQARLKRINRAEISVIDTTSIAISCNDGPLFDVPLRSNGETMMDAPPLLNPLTGKVEAEGMHGFSRSGKLTVTQTYPGLITVRSVTKNIVA